MKKIPGSEFKAKVMPADEAARDVFGCMAGTAEILGDVEAPVVRVRAWKSAR
jgi:hypothetical protein